MNQNKRLIAAAIAGIVLLAASAFALLSADPGQEHSPGRSLADPSEEFIESSEHSSVSVERLIDDYREWAQYPPNSRPLLPEHVDVLDYRKIAAPPQRMPRRDGDSFRDSGFSCQLQPERHSLTEGEEMRVFLSCMKTGQPERQSVRIKEVKLEASAGDKKFRLPQAAFSDAGDKGDDASGDSVYTMVFRPRASDWADVYVTVNFWIEADQSGFQHSLSTHFFSSPVAPARFTGQFREKLVEGSLVVSVEVNALKPGSYTLEANLMKGEVPVGYARQDAELPIGKSWVDLLYYGKVIRDREQAGPFELAGLRGALSTDVIQPAMLSRSPAEVEAFLASIRSEHPNRMLIPYLDSAYKTSAYSLSDFTSREYDSPEKQQRMDDLLALR